MIESKSNISSTKLIVYGMQQISIKEVRKLSFGMLILVETFFLTAVDYSQSDQTIVEFHVNGKTSHLYPYAHLNEHGDLVLYPMSVLHLEHLEEKFILLVIDQQIGRTVNQVIDDGVKSHSLNACSPIK